MTLYPAFEGFQNALANALAALAGLFQDHTELVDEVIARMDDKVMWTLPLSGL